MRHDSGTITGFGNLHLERDLALKILIDEFPNFKKEHVQEIKIFQTKTNALQAINEWTNKNPGNARRILKNIRFKTTLIYALFFITFLPTSTFKVLLVLNYKIKNWVNCYKFG